MFVKVNYVTFSNTAQTARRSKLVRVQRSTFFSSSRGIEIYSMSQDQNTLKNEYDLFSNNL